MSQRDGDNSERPAQQEKEPQLHAERLREIHKARLEETAKLLRLSGMTAEASADHARLVVGRELFSERIINDIARERERQEAKFSDQSHHPDGTGYPGADDDAIAARNCCTSA